MNDYIALFLGVLCAGIGGEIFVRGVVGLADWLRISSGIIGATVAAFATSSPELSVCITAALNREPQISLGDALGSNVGNVGLILGLGLVISSMQASGQNIATIRRDFIVALVAPAIAFGLLLDGVLSRGDGLLLLVIFLTWLVTVIIEVRKQRSFADQVLGEHHGWLIIVLCIVGLILLLAAGQLVLVGAKGIAKSWGIDEFIIGATVVAFGTSLPELATVIISKLRGHTEVGLGTILGSNIFNNLLVTGISATIYPIQVEWQEIAIALLFGFVTVGLSFPQANGLIPKQRGFVLLGLYILYLLLVVRR